MVIRSPFSVPPSALNALGNIVSGHLRPRCGPVFMTNVEFVRLSCRFCVSLFTWSRISESLLD